MVLTNGHCVGLENMITPGYALYQRPIKRSFFPLNSDGSEKVDSTGKKLVFKSTKLIYATMTRTDIAIYQLEQTYSELKKMDIEPYVVSREAPIPSLEVEIPSSYFRDVARCKVEKIVHLLREGGWTMQKSLRFSEECPTKHYTSGAPVVVQNTKIVVGINNTGSDHGFKCVNNNPCEVDDAGKIEMWMGRSYGQQIAQIYGCLDSERIFNLNLETCKLTKQLL